MEVDTVPFNAVYLPASNGNTCALSDCSTGNSRLCCTAPPWSTGWSCSLWRPCWLCSAQTSPRCFLLVSRDKTMQKHEKKKRIKKHSCKKSHVLQLFWKRLSVEDGKYLQKGPKIYTYSYSLNKLQQVQLWKILWAKTDSECCMALG